jgi:hypothetical protein
MLNNVNNKSVVISTINNGLSLSPEEGDKIIFKIFDIILGTQNKDENGDKYAQRMDKNI